MKRSPLIIAMCGMPAFVLGAAFHLPLRAIPATIARDTAAIEQKVVKSEPAAARAEAEPQADLYGNEVDRAVATYQIDTGGAMYELHAPDTAVLKLLPPRM